jgi:hypothetical protein
MATSPTYFPATLSRRNRRVTSMVGIGVFIGLPAVLAVAFALGFGQAWLLLVPLPFAGMVLLTHLLRPTGFAIEHGAIRVCRAIAASRIPLADVAAVLRPPEPLRGMTMGLVSVRGFFGTYGLFWNVRWGRFRAEITNPANTVQLTLRNGRRVLLSPDQPAAFAAAVKSAAGL